MYGDEFRMCIFARSKKSLVRKFLKRDDISRIKEIKEIVL